jgi:ketosteroid isomerase-like protein
MKKILFLIIPMFLGLINNAQEKNGTVYIQHPAIETTKKFWSAFEKGDKASAGAFLADSMVAIYNGNRDVQKKEDFLKSMDWWSTEFENLKIADDSPAYPDAIDYTKGGLWVQDWLLVTGTHKKSGINLNLSEHHLYSFNKDGKITSLHFYFNNNPFEEIVSSGSTQENGKIYINHPYIITVRKLVNAYCAKNITTMTEIYSPDATFSNSTMKWGESIDMKARKKDMENYFSEMDKINMRQVGYPDCIYYAKNDSYVVYSWWVLTTTSKADGKKTELPIMLSHTFNKEGKIVDELAYFSTNHFEMK